MNATATHSWYAEGLRWIAGLFLSAAERIEETSDTAGEDLFDSDAYLADVRNRVFTRYY